MMEAARTSDTLVNFYQTTRRYNSEDSHLRTHRRENLKSYIQEGLQPYKDQTATQAYDKQMPLHLNIAQTN
jgi:hypothetical protein